MQERRTGPRRRLLCIAEAVTLAHVARMHVLAKTAAARGHEVIFCAHPRYNALFGEQARDWIGVDTIPAEQFARSLDRGRPIYDEQTLSRYVAEDIRLIRAYAPDAVVGDFRLSLSVSARICGVPYAAISNAYWSPHASVDYPVPDIGLVRWFGSIPAQRLFDLARPLVFAFHAVPLNRVRRRHGLKPLAYDLRHTYTDADLTLYADLAEVVPMRDLPKAHRFIGPVLWAPEVALPDWWDRLGRNGPLIYVNLGSSGHGKVLPVIVETLARLPVMVMLATAGVPPPQKLPENVRLATYLPGDKAVERSDFVINNGGSPGCYQSFAAGKPVLAVPHNLDQFLNMRLVANYGAGLLMRPGAVSSASLAQAVKYLLSHSEVAAKARELQARMQSVHAPAVALDAIEHLWR